MNNLQDIATQLSSIDGVNAANVWEKATDSKTYRRIYLELPKLNGGKNWNGGRAGTVYYDADSNKIVTKRDWAGAKTRDRALDVLRDIKEKTGIDFDFNV